MNLEFFIVSIMFGFGLAMDAFSVSLANGMNENRMKVGIVIKPGTTVEYLVPWANQIDIALVMTVEPGFGGQKFMTYDAKGRS